MANMLLRVHLEAKLENAVFPKNESMILFYILSISCLFGQVFIIIVIKLSVVIYTPVCLSDCVCLCYKEVTLL